jgi:hypothetical protein
LVFPDESGYSSVSSLKQTWAPLGQTPTIRTSIEHNERLNMIGALGVIPHQRWIRLLLHGYRTSMTGEEVLAFLKDFLYPILGPFVMVWDKHPIHGRHQVQAFLKCHPRIRVYEFPTAAPELHPTEFVWTQVIDYTASTAPRTECVKRGLEQLTRESTVGWQPPHRRRV